MGGGGSQSTGEGWSQTSPGFMSELGAVLNRSMTGQSGFSKQDALTDVQGLMKQQATNMMQEALPKIAGTQNSAGAYNSTTKGLLNNDLQGRIAGQLAATQLQAVKDYAAIDADKIRAFAAATQAGTSTRSEHFENASSRRGWGDLFGGILRPIAGGVADQIAGPTKEAAFANGGRVPTPEETLLDQVINQLGLTKAAEAIDPSRKKQPEGNLWEHTPSTEPYTSPQVGGKGSVPELPPARAMPIPNATPLPKKKVVTQADDNEDSALIALLRNV